MHQNAIFAKITLQKTSSKAIISVVDDNVALTLEHTDSEPVALIF